jgi:hypothetical protein
MPVEFVELTPSQTKWKWQVHAARQAFEHDARRCGNLSIEVDGLLRDGVRDIARMRLESCLLPLDASLTRIVLLLASLR